MENIESILTSIKKLLGVDEKDVHFDPDIIMHINSVFSVLTQMGVGPSEGFSIIDEDAEWTNFMAGDPAKFSMVRSYMHLKVKLLFDPPSSSAAVNAMMQQISEFEWRLFEEADLNAGNIIREEETQNG